MYYCFGSDHFVSAVVLAQIMLCLLLEWLRSCCVWCWFGSDHVCLVLFWLRSCVSAVGLAQIMCVLCCFGLGHVSAVGLAFELNAIAVNNHALH